MRAPFANLDLVVHDIHKLSLIIDCFIIYAFPIQSPCHLFRNCILLYGVLSSSDLSCSHDQSSRESDVNELN
jgi:hypothetical protein